MKKFNWKEIGQLVGSIVAVFTIIILIAFAGKSTKEISGVNTVKWGTLDSYGYSEEVKTIYLEDCRSMANNWTINRLAAGSYCLCSLDYIEKNQTFDQFKESVDEYKKSGTTSQVQKDADKFCYQKYISK